MVEDLFARPFHPYAILKPEKIISGRMLGIPAGNPPYGRTRLGASVISLELDGGRYSAPCPHSWMCG
jgi:hypothetical protein